MIRALVVDDNQDFTGIVKFHAIDAGVDVTICSNGTDALKFLNLPDSKIDLVLLDLMMSPLDGLTIAEEIRRNEEIHLISTPVKMAFLTAAFISEAVERVGERVGIEKIFRKPCDYGEVFEEVKRWFE